MRRQYFTASRGLIMAAFLALSLFASGARAAAGGITGWWLDGKGDAAIVIAPCGDKLCGTIGWLSQPLDAKTGKPATDEANGDATLRRRPLCGLAMLSDFASDGPDHWAGGKIYDPDSGNTYSAHMTLLADGTLSVRGYIGISLFGRSEIWTRPARPPARCSPKM